MASPVVGLPTLAHALPPCIIAHDPSSSSSSSSSTVCVRARSRHCASSRSQVVSETQIVVDFHACMHAFVVIVIVIVVVVVVVLVVPVPVTPPAASTCITS